MTCEDAVLATHYARHKVTFLVGVSHSLLVYHRLCRCREIAPYNIKSLLDGSNLIESNGRTGISLNTTLPLAFLEITAETLVDDVS